MSLAGLAGELSVDLAAIKSIRFQLGSLNANTSIVSNSSGFDPSGCPFFRVVAGYERPEEEQSSDGWTFEAASFDAASGMATIPLSYRCPSYSLSGSSRASASAALGAMALALSRPALAAAMACGADAQASGCDDCTPILYLEFMAAHPNVTTDANTMTFTCPEEGCGLSASCSTEAPSIMCTWGWVAGRPFSTEDGPVLAPSVQSSSCWAQKSELNTSLDAGRGAWWRQNGLAEHGSVAAFSRASLELMAVGAPAVLVEGAHRAALDEIRHAEVSFGLAQGFGEAQAAPGRLPLKELQVTSELSELAKRTFQEGCVAEMVSLAKVKQQLRGELLPQEEAALQRIFEDEARHAAFAWRTVAWALSQDMAGVQPVLQQELEKLRPSERAPEDIHQQVRGFVAPWLRAMLAQGGGLDWRPPVIRWEADLAAATAEAVAKAMGGQELTV
ncbi:unnamed protein product [Effrenium voratum]|nr:unnamed protein product [Effrenium voratum]